MFPCLQNTKKLGKIYTIIKEDFYQNIYRGIGNQRFHVL